MSNKILVPLDGSKLAEEVLPLVHELAEVSGGEVILLRVVEYPSSLYLPCYEYPPLDPDVVQKIREEKAEISRDTAAYLERISAKVAAVGVKTRTEICDGPVVESILACIERLHIDQVVLSTYGQSGGAQGMIGATANRVLREAPVPVILARLASAFVAQNVSELPRAV